MKSNIDDKRILLTITPYWDPMIPPMGITSLKSFLQKNGFIVKTVDLIVHPSSLDFYHKYFKILKGIVPIEKHGNFNNIGHDVLQNHLMAHQNYLDKRMYIIALKSLIYNHYYVNVEDEQILELINITEEFFNNLETVFVKILDDFNPHYVGTTAYKCTLATSLFVLKISKNKNKSIKTLMGGGTFNESHAPGSPSWDVLLKLSENYVDKIFLGPSEILFLKYLRGELDNNQRVYSKEDIENKILDFKDSDLPDFSDLDLNNYPYLAATASVGCIYDCSFCVAKKVTGGYRSKLPRQLVDEMILMSEKYKKQLFFMTDSLINPVISEISNELIKRNVSLYFDAYFKVDEKSTIQENTFLWRKAGLYRVRIGTESGSQKILNEMNKGITIEQTKATLSAFAFAGIKTTTYWVIGHPGETEEDFQMTLSLIEEMKDDIYQAECNYFLYHYSNQGNSDIWAKNRKALYPENVTKLIHFKYWTLNIDPLREETFNRIHRFEKHCRNLGIPNPYSLNEYKDADKRWSELHKNAVPPFINLLSKGEFENENTNFKIPILAQSVLKYDDKFSF